MSNRDKMQKPDWMTEEEFAWFKQSTSSLDLIKKDAHADVADYLANPAGRAEGKSAKGGFPTLLLTTKGRKSGQMRTNPAVFMRNGNDLVLVAEIGGHKRLETTRRYSLPTRGDKEKALEELSLD